jgi:serine/threonine-protein kinase RsbW
MAVARARGHSSGQDAAHSISFPNSMAGLKHGARALGRWLRGARLSAETEDRAQLVFDEIVTNTIRYAFPDGDDHTITVRFAHEDGAVSLFFEDDGIAFNPCTVARPAAAETLAEAPVGGRGLILVRKAAKRLDYERTEAGRNRLRVTLF